MGVSTMASTENCVTQQRNLYECHYRTALTRRYWYDMLCICQILRTILDRVHKVFYPEEEQPLLVTCTVHGCMHG